MVLVGNPLSGISSAPERLPEPAGALGPLLPPGAGGSLLRSTAFFDGAGVGLAALGRRSPGSLVAPGLDPVTVP
jgi:hypothetical protein